MTASPTPEVSLDDLFRKAPEKALIVSEGTQSPQDLIREVVPLDPSDLLALSAEGPAHSYVTVQHTRAYHHIAALKLAAGEKAGEVARQLRLTPCTISRLQQDPQFAELIESYRGDLVSKAVGTFELLNLISLETAQAIHERVSGDERDQIPLESLRRLIETVADRTGHSPIRRSESLNVNASGSISDITLERVKQIHGEDAHYKTQSGQQALEEGHKKEARDQGAEDSISAIFEPVEELKVIPPASKGASV